MHVTIQNLLNIKSKVNKKISLQNISSIPTIVAVSKTFKIEYISNLINHGHLHFGENKVQEAVEKWGKLKEIRKDLKLHLIGKLQTNKVKFAIKLFDYIHSLDNEKLAIKISSAQKGLNRDIKLFIQVNIGDEEQKSGIKEKDLFEFYKFCLELKLNVIGLMCIPPMDKNSNSYFKKMLDLKNELKLNELSMGMSSDYLNAIDFGSTYLRIGSEIFGQRY
tara:strand:- start:116 stop:775 length:660 start_codon:yes stop_codon:yes gene_type:complete